MSSVAAAAPEQAKPWWLDLLTTVDHKKIGLMYTITSFAFFAIGGLYAMLIRAQLTMPDQEFIVGRLYNQVLTMHGTTMQFLFIIPVAVGLGNYFLPLMIGARDMALPRLNAFGYWMYLFGGLLIYAGPLLGLGYAEGGWVAYYPFSRAEFQVGLDPWLLGLQLVGFSSIFGGVNFIATAINLRTPGMGWRQFPMFGWGLLATSFLAVLATPGITAATVLTWLDRTYDISLFNPAIGGDPVLYQHLFWFYSHPAVYIMVLPWFGIVSEILPTFTRKPIFGYVALAGATMGIALVSMLVWAHHMFTAMGSPLLNSIFAFTTMLVAVPTGIKIFNWLATVWRGRIVFNTAMLMSLGFIFLFTIGGITGVALAIVPFTWQMHDSYWVVAHFHNVLIGGSILILMAGIFYWFPKMTGRFLDERLGIWLFWLWFVGFMLTYFPQYILGMLGMPRRIYTYQAGLGWELWNVLSTLGAIMLAVGFMLFVYNVIISLRGPRTAGPNPWDGYTLEWATASPPAPHNFEYALPSEFKSERPLYDWKRQGLWPPQESSRLRPADIHLPTPSLWPLVTTLGLTVLLLGLVLQGPLVWFGLALTLYASVKWALEPAFESEAVELEVEHHNRTKIKNGLLGSYWFLASEAALFLMLFASFFYLLLTGRMYEAFAALEALPSVELALLNTALLVSSSVTVHYAHHALLHDRRPRFIALLGATVGLGAIFLGVTGIEWAEVLHYGRPQENLFLAAFFVITGLHALHVVIGLFMLGLALVRGLMGHFTPKLHNGVEVPVAYWHLVDVIWIFVLLIVYVLPNFYQGPERVTVFGDPFAVYQADEFRVQPGLEQPVIPFMAPSVEPEGVPPGQPEPAPAAPEPELEPEPDPETEPVAIDLDAWRGAYTANCAACHQATGQGVPGAFPPLAGHAPELAAADGGREYLIEVVLYGLQGEITVLGNRYNAVMAPLGHMSDEAVANAINYALHAWENDARLPEDFAPIAPEEVAALRGQGLSMAQMLERRQALELEE